MKKKIIIIAMVIATCLGSRSVAQVSVNFNLGVQPVWGPVGYDYVEYYYLPGIEMYYYVPRGEYVYFDNGQWITVSTLPPRYRNYDFYTAQKVVINEPMPWRYHDKYKKQYAGYHSRQRVIRDATQYKYWENPGHPKHNQWKGRGQGQGHYKHGGGHEKGHGGGHGKGRGGGHGKGKGH